MLQSCVFLALHLIAKIFTENQLLLNMFRYSLITFYSSFSTFNNTVFLQVYLKYMLYILCTLPTSVSDGCVPPGKQFVHSQVVLVLYNSFSSKTMDNCIVALFYYLMMQWSSIIYMMQLLTEISKKTKTTWTSKNQTLLFKHVS